MGNIFLLIKRGLRLNSSPVGLHGPVNRIASTSSRSSIGGGRQWYSFGTGDSKEMTCDAIFRKPELATRIKQLFTRTRETNSLSIYVRQDRTSGTAPNHSPFASAYWGTVPFRSIRQAPWPVTRLPKFWFRQMPKIAVTSPFFRLAIFIFIFFADVEFFGNTIQNG